MEYNEGGYIIPYFSNQIDAYSAKVGGFVEAKSGFPLAQLLVQERRLHRLAAKPGSESDERDFSSGGSCSGC